MAKYISKYTGAEIDNTLSQVSQKIGDIYFDPINNVQYFFKSAEDKLAWLDGNTSIEVKTCPFEFSGTVRKMTVVNGMDNKQFYYTQKSESAIITVGFKSEEKGITDTSWTEVTEDATIKVEIDRGVSGNYETIIDGQTVLNGNTFSFDVFKYLATGNNRVRVTATGVDTGSSSNLVYQVLLTSMYLSPAQFKWNIPFIEGQPYSLGGLYIGGNLDKILKIKVSNEHTYSKTYEINIGTQTNTSIAYYYNGLEFPTEGTGVYNVELWLDANGLESEHLHYNIICIAEADVKTAQLIAVSNVLPTVKNYDTNTLFSYVVYNGGATTANPIVNVSAIINNTPTVIVSNEELKNVAAGEINNYIIDLEIDSQEYNIQLYSSIELGDCKQEAVYGIDNTKSYPAISGAVFYMNPANRNNSQGNRTTIVNESNVAKVPAEYNATWSGVSFTDGMDGWTEDNEGRKCLRLPATSKIEIDYAPFANAVTRTLEISYKVENSANFNEDIITIATDLTSKFLGVRVKPTNVLLHSNLMRTDDLKQGYNTKDEELVHLLVTVIQNYKQIGNLAQIYVNGVKKCSFEWSASDSFAHNGTVKIGSDTADLYIYKMRVYTDAFDWIMAMQNFISCLPDTKPKDAAYSKMRSVLNDGNKIDFDQVKKNGLNYFVLRLPQGKSLPSILSQSSVPGTRLVIDIQQNKDFVINGTYEDEETEGQGTTAMNYFRWNLRWKTDTIRVTAKKNFASSMHSHKMGATGLFNDLNRMIVGANEADGRVAVEQYGAYGFLEELVEGTTDQYVYTPIGLYTIGQDKGDKSTFGYNNKTYKSTLIHLEGTDHSPKAVGMDYPWDKINVATNSEGDSNLGVQKTDGTVIAAWEIGACGEAESDAEMYQYLTQEFKPAYNIDYLNTSMIVGLEAGTTIDEVNANLSAFRAMPTDNGYTYADCLVWIDEEYDTYYYDVVQEKYIKDGVNILTDLGISASDLTGATVEEKNNEIRALRKARYRAEMENYWHLRDSLFHYCFVVLFAATDNFKKNTYPYKFGTLASGSRWRWRQDDLDTLFDINNQGLANKIYSLMNGDKSGTTHLFRGNTSYHWTNIQFYYENEIKSMMLEVMTAMASLGEGGSLIEKAIDCIRKYFWNKAQDYFTKSAYNLDAEWSYEEAWAATKNGTYIEPVPPLEQSLGSHYEAERAFVELRFIFMASMYGFGAFGVGNDSDTSLGQISFRPAQGDNTFNLTPAINMNPTILVGDSDAKSANQRLEAGEASDITISTDGDTSIYIQGTDYLSDIGDFSQINLYAENPQLTVQGKRLQTLKVGDESADKVKTLLKSLNILACPSLSEIDARNVSTLTGTIDLSQCPRLTKALFGGSSAGEILLPKGSKITEFELPDTITNLSLVNLPKLGFSVNGEEGDVTSKYSLTTGQSYGQVGNKIQFTTDGNYQHTKVLISNVSYVYVQAPSEASSLVQYVDSNDKILKLAVTNKPSSLIRYDIEEVDGAVAIYVSSKTGTLQIWKHNEYPSGGLQYNTLTALTYLRVENNANISGYGLLKATIEDGAQLKNIRIIGFDYDGDVTDTALLATLANGEYFGISSDGSPNPNSIPVIEGTLNIAGSIYEDDAKVIESNYGSNLILNVTGGYYMKFQDPEVLRVLLANGVGDGNGITTDAAEKVTSIGTWFNGNTTIETFDEFEKFTGVTELYHSTNESNGAFRGCISLVSIKLPESLSLIGVGAFTECTSLANISLSNVVTIKSRAFRNCASLSGDIDLPLLQSLNGDGFFANTKIKSFNAPLLTSIPSHSSLNDYGAFAKNTTLIQVNVPHITSIGNYSFYGCTSLSEFIGIQNLTNIGTQAFFNCTSLGYNETLLLQNAETIGTSAFYSTGYKNVIINGNIKELPRTSSVHGVFGNMPNLELIDLPSTLTSIGRFAFYLSKKLNTIICRADVPPTVDSAFYYNDATNLKIYVPDASIEAYKTATNWSSYADRIYPMSVWG